MRNSAASREKIVNIPRLLAPGVAQLLMSNLTTQYKTKQSVILQLVQETLASYEKDSIIRGGARVFPDRVSSSDSH